MLKSCTYCGKIHDSHYECPEKTRTRTRYCNDTMASHLRSLSRWQKTRDYIRERDHNVCQLCLKNYPGTLRPYETEGLSVHHIDKIEDDSSKAFDEYNLITLCRVHHELAESGEIDKEILRAIAKENSDAATR